MKSDRMPISSEVLIWARERAGYSLKELMGMSKFCFIADWESGCRRPTYLQLEDLAAKLKVPVAVFFFPSPPDLPQLQQSFRTVGSEEFARIPPRIRLLMLKAHGLQMGLEELYESPTYAQKQITHALSLSPNESVEEAASRAREFIGIPVTEQQSWTSVEKALKNWRAALLKAGVYVFKDQFRQEGYSGFSLHHEEFPVIYVNNSTSKTRQIFTLFHELAHLLLGTSGIFDDTELRQPGSSYRQEEALVNRFASCFLVPEPAFESELGSASTDETAAARLASRFRVSREVINRRFLDRKLITSSEYQRRLATKANNQSRGTGGNYYVNQVTYLGLEYIRTAFAHYNRNQIDSFQLADYLNVKPSNLERLEAEVLRRDIRA